MNANVKNEKLKRSFFKWLREAKGFSESTVVAVESALGRWEEFTHNEDFGRFTSSKAVSFKKYLDRPNQNGKALSANSRYHCLAHVRLFFQWLSTQPGFKSRITAEAISYLTLDRKTVQSISSPGPKKCPAFEHVRQLVDSIEIKTEIDQRDQALVAFLFLSGMRDNAVATLPLGCFDPETLEVRQNPQKGVATKFGKSIVSHLVKFDQHLLDRVKGWVRYLREERLFTDADPLFPRTKVAQGDNSMAFESQGVERVFWRGAGSIRSILKERSEQAKLPYFYPHLYRHGHIRHAMRFCRTAEEMRAVSQNVGHEHIGTTLQTYGKLDDFRLAEVIDCLDFEGSTDLEMSPEEVNALEKLLIRNKKRT